jgi:hypothetical protein
MEASIVRPLRRQHSPSLGALAVMISNAQDLSAVCRAWSPGEGLQQQGLFNSRLFHAPHMPVGSSAAGPIIGAPYAVMILETLVAWGARQILYFGWCGALTEDLQAGDLLLPTGAVIDEGTSPAYGLSPGQTARPHGGWLDFLRSALADLGLAIHWGPVWSTDAVFRETPSRVARFAAQGALAVEMEVSALYTAARCLRVPLAAVLVVSDSLASGRWKPGFSTPRFVQARGCLCGWIGALLQDPPPGLA